MLGGAAERGPFVGAVAWGGDETLSRLDGWLASAGGCGRTLALLDAVPPRLDISPSCSVIGTQGVIGSLEPKLLRAMVMMMMMRMMMMIVITGCDHRNCWLRPRQLLTATTHGNCWQHQRHVTVTQARQHCSFCLLIGWPGTLCRHCTASYVIA